MTASQKSNRPSHDRFDARAFRHSSHERALARRFQFWFWPSAFLLSFLLLSGCGTGGYIGGGIQSLSRSSAAIDATQSISVSANLTAGLPISWTLGGNACSVAAGCGTISSTTSPTVTYEAPSSVVAPIQVQLVGTVPGTSDSSTATITVNPVPQITGNPPSAVLGVQYSTKLTASGGTGALTLAMSGGQLPPGLTFNASTGIISGTPTTVGTFTAALSVTDSSDIPLTEVTQEAITVVTQSTSALIISGNPPSGVVGTTYFSQLSASGGVTPYSWSISSGSLPPGLTINSATGLISGTPTTAGVFGFAALVTDSAGTKATASFVIDITATTSPLTLTTSTLPAGTVGVAYSAQIGVTGGTSPYTCVLVSGSVPAGLSLGANCAVSGTPTTAETLTFSVKVTDSANPANTITGPESITINPANGGGGLTLTLTPPQAGTVGTPYTGSIGVSGGVGPYTCALLSGTVPPGLTLSANCTLTGTPTTAGSYPVTIIATDSSNPANTTTGSVTITINSASVTLKLTSPPAGTVGTPYIGSIGVSGGTAPYTCSLVGGTLPAGLTLNSNCSLSGTPTTAGTSSVTVKATDSASPSNSTTGPVSITINSAGITLTLTSPPAGTVGTPYTGSIGVSGGTAPYTCSLVSGALPAGLTLNSNCSLSGTPTTAGTSSATVNATDSASPSNSTTGSVSITINSATTTLALTAPPVGIVGTPYTGSIGVSGGTAPYTCSLLSGPLPPGLTLNANCSLSGTPTTAGSYPVIVKATDSASPANSTSGSVTITINPVGKLTLALNGSLPYAILNQSYSQTLQATGGIQPYTYAITAGSLPPGITLSTGGVISGTPTAVGAYSFTVTVTDTETPAQTASLPLILQVIYPTGPNDGELNGPYAYLFQGYDDVAVGLLAYQTATIGSFTANGAGVLTNGELDANHQASTSATGNTVTTQQLLGTYTIGSDNRGSMAITSINADGTVGTTTIYSIVVKAPVSPATTTASGDLIESDDANLVGTRGSGTFLAQTSSAFATGLTGSYAFGTSGDTPCLLACTVGIIAGPAASVGEFAVTGNSVSGVGDANIASTNIASSTLAGTWAAADTNGRVQLTLNTSSTPAGVYPVDYAVYMVNANQAFVLSTDVHSSYILLAGTMTQQAQNTFTSTSMSGPFVGYENGPTNPGLAGVVLQNVLNLSTATIFRGTSTTAGSCTTTNVDEGGTVGLVNGLTGLGSGSSIVNALLGTYQSLGNSSCVVQSNGRMVLNYPAPSTILSGVLSLLGLAGTPPPPRVVYLYGQNQGYFLETGYATLGHLALQTGVPFSAATLSGTFIYGTAPAASLASINGSGTFVANGAGSATTTLDENVGVGNINLLQFSTTETQSYTLTDSTAGRYLLGTSTVIYAISPNQFVLVDTSATTTSPSIALIQ
jgi:hypothetical protein